MTALSHSPATPADRARTRALLQRTGTLLVQSVVDVAHFFATGSSVIALVILLS